MANPKQVTTDFTLARTSLITGAYALAQKMRQGQPLLLLREPTSKIDPNDVMVFLPTVAGNRKIGYLPLGLAKEIAPLMDSGVKVIARKAPNVLYGVCQLAYIPPEEPAPLVATIQPVNQEEPLTAPVTATVGELVVPEGVTFPEPESDPNAVPATTDQYFPQSQIQEDTNGEPRHNDDAPASKDL